jgi:CRISPR-associated protein (TIGR03986 family)
MKSASSGKLVYVIEPTEMERMPIAEAKDLMGNDAPGTEVMYTAPDNEDYIVVRTGMVPGKLNEFGFRSQGTASPMAVSDPVFQNFITAHQYNAAWWVQNGHFDQPGYLQTKLRNNERIPVFYTVGEDKKVSAIGLAFMFRVAYKHSLVDAMAHTSNDHRDDPMDFDLTQALFGALPGDAPGDGLRSRVSFGALFSSKGTVQAVADKVVLNNPKPSFYPAYLKQDSNALKDLEAINPELAGWKRYQVRSSKDIYQTGDGNNDAVASKLRPLQAGAQFSGVIRFHNLRPAELGALVWALTWGGNDKLRHSLGMGKPYGYGNVAVQITGAHVTHNNDSAQDFGVERDPLAVTQKLAFAVAALTTMMKDKVSQWPATPELKELCAMANPAVGDAAAQRGQLRYPMLNPKKRVNDFKDIKNANAKLAKPSSFIKP